MNVPNPLGEGLGETPESEIPHLEESEYRLEAAFLSRNGQAQDQDSSTDDEGESVEEEEEDGGEDDPADSSPPSSQDGELIEFRGKKLTPEQVETLLALDEQLRTDPKFVEHVGKYWEQETNPPAPTPSTPTTPVIPEEYLQNPAFKTLYDLVEQQKQELERLRGGYSTIEQEIAARRRAENEAYVNTATQQFRSQYDSLTEEEFKNLRELAGKMEVLPAFMKQGMDPVTAITKTLEYAYWSIPEFRDREIQKQAAATTQTQTRRKKATALSGSGGSASRQPAPPKNETERRQAMIAEIAGRFG